MIFIGGMSSDVIVCGMMRLSMNPWEQVASATNFKEMKNTRTMGIMVDSDKISF